MPLKMDGWNTFSFPFGILPIFRGYVSFWLFLVPLKGGIGSIFHPPEGKDYKWYISGMYCQLGDYMPPTTF